jgi:hypothetical protein
MFGNKWKINALIMVKTSGIFGMSGMSGMSGVAFR